MIPVTDLFAPVVEEGRFHPQFRDLRNAPAYASARSLMSELYSRMGDPNGNFVRDFQSQAFHARLFELACFAYLESANLTIDRSFERPDFIAWRDGLSVAIEAVTANPPADRSIDISVAQMPQLSHEEIFEKVAGEVPKRMTAILRRKLAHRYHEAPQVSGKPFVLMIAPCFEPGAGFYTDDALLYCLYGPPESEPMVHGRPAFFWQEEAATVSAILYCNAFTVSRFFRLTTPLGPHSNVTAIRSGTCYVNHSASECAIKHFEYRVGDPAAPHETWSEGVTIFQNPFAQIPLPDDFLPATSIISVREGYVHREVIGFHTVVSYMVVHVPEGTSTAPD